MATFEPLFACNHCDAKEAIAYGPDGDQPGICQVCGWDHIRATLAEMENPAEAVDSLIINLLEDLDIEIDRHEILDNGRGARWCEVCLNPDAIPQSFSWQNCNMNHTRRLRDMLRLTMAALKEGNDA